MRVFLFDIDGTLLLTGGVGLETLQRVFRRRYGLPHAVEGIEFHGRTDPLIIRSIARKWLDRELTAEELSSLSDDYVRCLEEVLSERPSRFRVLPGARELVEALHADGQAVLGLATGNFERSARAKLRHAGLERYFAFGGFASDSEDRLELTRRAVERGRSAAGGDAPVLVIGDTIHDVRCAVTLGVDCLAVATGNAPEEVLAAAGARWTVPTLESPAVRRIVGLDHAGRPD